MLKWVRRFAGRHALGRVLTIWLAIAPVTTQNLAALSEASSMRERGPFAAAQVLPTSGFSLGGGADGTEVQGKKASVVVIIFAACALGGLAGIIAQIWKGNSQLWWQAGLAGCAAFAVPIAVAALVIYIFTVGPVAALAALSKVAVSWGITGLVTFLSGLTSSDLVQAVVQEAIAGQIIDHILAKIEASVGCGTGLVLVDEMVSALANCVIPAAEAEFNLIWDEVESESNTTVVITPEPIADVDYSTGAVLGSNATEVATALTFRSQAGYHARHFPTAGLSRMDVYFSLQTTPSHTELQLLHGAIAAPGATIDIMVNGQPVATGITILAGLELTAFDITSNARQGSNVATVALSGASLSDYDVGRVTIIAAGGSATIPTQPGPQLTVDKATVSSGETFRLSWTPVVGAGQYFVESSNNPSFTGANPVPVPAVKTWLDDQIFIGNTSVTRYYRVRSDNSTYSGLVSVTALAPPGQGDLVATPPTLTFSGPLGGVSSQTDVVLTINGLSSFTWSAFAVLPPGAPRWLSVTSSSGTAGQPVTVRADPSKVGTGGPYTGTVEVYSPEANTSPLLIPVTFNVSTGAASGIDLVIDTAWIDYAYHDPRDPTQPRSQIRYYWRTKNIGTSTLQAVTTRSAAAADNPWWADSPFPATFSLPHADNLQGELLNYQRSLPPNTYIEEFETDALPAQAYTVGQNYLIFVTDADWNTGQVFCLVGLIAEPNECNNYYVVPFYIPKPPAIQLIPTSLSFTLEFGEVVTKQVIVSNLGDQSLQWNVTGAVPGLAVIPASSNFMVSADGALLGVGHHDLTLTISGNATNGTQTLPVSVDVQPAPLIQASLATDSVVSNGVSVVPLSIANLGGGTLNWSIIKSASWLTLSASSGSGPAQITVSTDARGLPAGLHRDTLRVSAPWATNAPLDVPIVLDVPALPPEVVLAPSVVGVVGSPGEVGLLARTQVLNGGGGTLAGLTAGTVIYGPGEPSGWLTPQLTSLTAPATLTLHATAAALGVGSYAARVPISGAAAIPDTVLVTLLVRLVSPTQLAVTGQPGGAFSGQPLSPQPIVELQDALSQPVPQGGVVVTAAKASGTGALGGTLTATTDAQGRATFTDLQITGAGPHTLSFDAPGLTGATSQSFGVTGTLVITTPSPLPAGFTSIDYPWQFDAVGGSGTYLWGVSGGNLPPGVVLSQGGVFSGFPITLGNYTFTVSVQSGNESAQKDFDLTIYDPPLVVTDSLLPPAIVDSSYSFQLLGGGGNGTYGWIFSGAGTLPPGLGLSSTGLLSGTPTVVGSYAFLVSMQSAGFGVQKWLGMNVQNVLEPATQVALTTEPTGAISGVVFTTQPVAELRDGSNQPVPQSGVLVTAAKASGTGTLGGTLTGTTDAQGRATFTDLQITGTGPHTLSFDAPGLTGTTSQSFTVSPPAATQLTLTTEPTGAVSGVAFTTQPVAELRDGSNQPVLQSGVVVTVGRTSGTGMLGGTLTATTDAQGRATFTDLQITGTGPHTLSFDVPGLTGTTSQSFTVGPPAATQLTLVTDPSGATSGVVFTMQPVVELRDGSNQPVLQSGVVVTVTKASGAGTLGGTLTATTDALGRAMFADLQITGTGLHTMSFDAPGLIPATSSPFMVSPPPVTQLGIATQPGGAVSGVPFTTPPVVDLRDAQNQPVLQSGVVVTVAKASGSGMVGGTLTATTDAQGRATFTDLQITGTGPHTLSFDAPGLTPVTSSPFMVSPSPATQLAIAIQPGGAVTRVPFTTQPVLDLRDAQNQPVLQSGVVVTAAKASGAGTLSGTLTAITDAQGRATFTDLQITGTGPHTLSFDAPGLTGAVSQSFVVSAPPPTHLVLVTQPGGAQSGQSLNPQPVVELRDIANMPVQQGGIVVTAAKATGPGTLGGTTTVMTNAQGRAVFTNLVVTGSGTHTIDFTSTALTKATSQAVAVRTVPSVAVDSMTAVLTGRSSFSPSQIAQYDCNGNSGLDVGDLLCYLDAHPGVPLSAQALTEISGLKPIPASSSAPRKEHN